MDNIFSTVLNVNQRERAFNFRPLSNNEHNPGYHVEVQDDKGNNIAFSMYQSAEGKWRTAAQKLPLWIHNAERVLGDAIESYITALKKSL